MLRAAVALSIFAGCTTERFDAKPTRYVVDSVTVPTAAGQAAAFGYDFDGDGAPANAFGNLTTDLALQGDITNDVGDLFNDGLFTSTIDVVESDDGKAAQITWDTIATLTTSITSTGALVSEKPERVDIAPHIPVLVDADPTPILFEEAVIELLPDGSGGYDAQVGALGNGSAFRAAAAASLVQMIASNPRAHVLLGAELGSVRDNVASAPDVLQTQLFQELTSSDQANDQISIGYRFHLASCAAGRCNGAPIVDHCHDRVVDADETGLDCGGSCHPCSGGLACGSDADCDSQVCDAGACRFATCYDGVQDGLETGSDCGDGCAGCSAGEACIFESDCESGHCNDVDANSLLGTCT
jgi:hypothetical protein